MANKKCQGNTTKRRIQRGSVRNSTFKKTSEEFNTIRKKDPKCHFVSRKKDPMFKRISEEFKT